MIRKALIIFLMVPLLVGAMVNGASFPVVVLMGSLILIALIQSPARDEQEKYKNNRG